MCPSPIPQFAHLPGHGRIELAINGGFLLRGLIASVSMAEGSAEDASQWQLLTVESNEGEDRVGPYDQLRVTHQTSCDLFITATFRCYCARPVLSMQIAATNVSQRDLFLTRLGGLHCDLPVGAVEAGFNDISACIQLDQVFYWTGHQEFHHYLRRLSSDNHRAYWTTLLAEPRGHSLVIGVGGPATGQTEISLWQHDTKIGLEVGSNLYSSLNQQRALRLPMGATHTCEPVLWVIGNDPWQTLLDYVSLVKQLLDFHPLPAYAGLFSAYGSDSDNRDPAATPLTEERIRQLTAVVDRYLQPYGLDTIKTQFRGLSSSGYERRIGSAEVAAGAATELIATIREQGWCGDGVHEDFPHGIPHHVAQLTGKGYRPALVCRPFLNIKAGTPELDEVAADLFAMTVNDWGYRYLMLDFISADYESENDALTVEEGIYRRFKAIRERLGQDIFIEACMVWPGPILGIADGYRPGHDWRGGLEHELLQIFASRYYYHGHLFQLDNEFFDPALHPFTWGSQGREGMQGSLERVRTWVSFCGLLGMSYLTGAALERVSPQRWHLFQRALPVMSGQAQPLDILEASPPRRWRRDVSSPAGLFCVLGLFNYDEEKPSQIVVRPADWHLDADTPCLFYDFWSEQVFGPAQEITLWLNPFGCRVLFAQPLPKRPALLGSTRHVAGITGLKTWEYDEQTLVLRVTVTGAPNSEERYHIWLPGNESVTQCTGAQYEIERPHLLRIAVQFGPSGYAEWALKLNRETPVL